MNTVIPAIAIGGGLGSVARYLTVTGATRLFGVGFPVGTLVVNVVGSFAIGFISFWLLRQYPGSENARFFLTTGFLGGFTTFSAFSLDVLNLVQQGALSSAMIYVLASVALAVLAVFAGFALAVGLSP